MNHGTDISSILGTSCSGQPNNLQALMDSRRSKSKTKGKIVTQDIIDRQKAISTTKQDFINEKISEKKSIQSIIQKLKS